LSEGLRGLGFWGWWEPIPEPRHWTPPVDLFNARLVSRGPGRSAPSVHFRGNFFQVRRGRLVVGVHLQRLLELLNRFVQPARVVQRNA